MTDKVNRRRHFRCSDCGDRMDLNKDGQRQCNKCNIIIKNCKQCNTPMCVNIIVEVDTELCYKCESGIVYKDGKEYRMCDCGKIIGRHDSICDECKEILEEIDSYDISTWTECYCDGNHICDNCVREGDKPY